MKLYSCAKGSKAAESESLRGCIGKVLTKINGMLLTEGTVLSDVMVEASRDECTQVRLHFCPSGSAQQMGGMQCKPSGSSLSLSDLPDEERIDIYDKRCETAHVVRDAQSMENDLQGCDHQKSHFAFTSFA